jgi:hypothetical protein
MIFRLTNQVHSVDDQDHLKQSTALVDAQPASARMPAKGWSGKSDLVDDDGFPRADIDVYQVRVIRQQLARTHKPSQLI